MALPYTTKMVVELDLKVRLTFWEALKIRVAGHGFQTLIRDVRESMLRHMHAQREDDENG